MAARTTLKTTLSSYEWYDPANWTNGLPVAGVAETISGVRTLSLRLAPLGAKPKVAGELDIYTAHVTLFGGELDLQPAAAAHGLTYDVNLKKGASLTVAASATLVGHQTLALGFDGAPATLSVMGTVVEDFTYVVAGKLTVTGSGHYITGASGIAVGGENGAALVVSHGGVIDEGRLGLSQFADSLSIGEGAAPGTALVTGLGSLVSMTSVYVGANGHGTLTIANGAVVQDQVGVMALNGDATVLITGQGSRWDNFSGLTVGEVFPTDTKLTVVNSGQLDWGAGGFSLQDTLSLDGSALLGGQKIYDRGEIEALAGKGDVFLEQDISIGSNWLFQFHEVADLFSQKGVALELDGQITGSASSEIRIASGDVIVTNAGNDYGFTEIYSGRLEVESAGALGQGLVEFSAGAAARAELEIGAVVRLDNVITGFGATDRIALDSIQFTKTMSKIWVENANQTGGALTVSNGSEVFTLNFQGAYAAGDFRVSDNAGGTLVTIAPAHAAA